MSYRAKAKTIAEAVSRDPIGPLFSMGACYGTKIQRRLSFVEIAEKTSDWYEYVKLKEARRTHGTLRAAVAAGYFEENIDG